MKIKINYKKAIIWGVVVWIIQNIIGNLLYMNPVVSTIFARYEGHPTMKTYEFAGGVGNWILLNFLFGTIFITICIILYLTFYHSIPGDGWKKGLFFGLVIAFLKSVPEAFNQWMLFVYPGELILVQLVNSVISLILFGMILGFIFRKFQVVTAIH